MMLQLNGVRVRYGSIEALGGVSLSLAGGAVGLLGPNGAGKSTLLKVLLGFIVPQEGSAKVLDLDVRSSKLEVRSRVGYMPEIDCHIPGMNAVRYVAYAGELCGMRRSDAMQRAHEVLQYVGLGEARYREMDTYSTGMRQRAKLAQALVHDPGLLFLDEPTSGMDPRGREEMLDLIRDISRNKGIQVIISTHILPDVEHSCEEMAVLHKGKLVASGSIQEMKMQSGRRVEIRVKGNGESLSEKLNQIGCNSEPLERGDFRGFRVLMPEELRNLELFRIASESGVQIRHLQPIKSSLEDVFLRAIGEDMED